ncbi:MAG TPA: SpoIIIAH-like family protein [Candidatus Avimonoglobus intestinipullorum]|uniref:SpoIIIAH-like family protein n=1 Tax=Candidatus Avimonoglobus intestinipullorum TaxID=2840699 RepID=A0A9D1LTL9_9FIRM|nr:SpoIIIAH-like family protein [Candidatus Avimonoglobus intestinipullorum]
MMVLKRKEIIAAALVVLIGVAGYLNWSYQDTIRVTDGDSYIETGKKLGEAQYVNSNQEDVEDGATAENTAAENQAAEGENQEENTETQETAANSGDYFVEAKLEKESARSKALEILNQTAANESFDRETREKAQEQILSTAKNVEKEAAIENIAKAKGYPDISVYIDGEEVNIIVRKDGFSEEDVAKIKDIATEQLGISGKNIKIVQVQ